MMPDDAAHRTYWRTSDVVFGVPLLLAVALQWLVPLSLPRGRFDLVFVIAGGVLGVVGVALVASARRELARQGQPADPGRPTSTVVTTGVFSFSRNPLYLGVVCLVLGIGLAFKLPWVLLFVLPSIVACQRILIAPEERYLTSKFGDEYREYTASVRRWLGRAHASRP